VVPPADPTLARPFLKHVVCKGQGSEVRVTERKGAWTRIWLRVQPMTSIVVAGWIRTPVPFGIAPCPCSRESGHGRGMGGWGARSAYLALRDLPLYPKADRAARPVGVLFKEQYEFEREVMPATGAKAPDFVPVQLAGARLWVPYHPGYFKYRRASR
jgi:hypothetical protein